MHLLVKLSVSARKCRQRLIQTKIYTAQIGVSNGVRLKFGTEIGFLAMRMWHLQNVFHISHIYAAAAVPVQDQHGNLLRLGLVIYVSCIRENVFFFSVRN